MPRLLLALLAVLALTAAVACSDDDGNSSDPEPASAADIPDGIPSLDGEEFSDGTRDGDNVVANSNVATDAATVREFFEREIPAAGEFRIIDTVENPDGSTTIVIEDVDDPNRTGAIVIDEEDDGTTRIVKTIGRHDDDDDEDEDQEVDNSPDGDGEQTFEGELPPNYPDDDVPFPGGSTIEQSSVVGESGSQFFNVEFTSELSPAELLDEFGSSLTANGWTLGDEFEDDPNGFNYTYERDGDQVTLTGEGGDTGSNANITIVDVQ